jgi:glycopeptide antibiotics resistance protein
MTRAQDPPGTCSSPEKDDFLGSLTTLGRKLRLGKASVPPRLPHAKNGAPTNAGADVGCRREVSRRIVQDTSMDVRTEPTETRRHQHVRPVAPRWVFVVCFLIYAAVVAWVTLRPRPSSVKVPVEWIPFNNIIHVLRDGRSVSYQTAGQLLGNIALFVPFGWLVPMLWRKLRFVWLVVALAGATSVAIEVSQRLFITGRETSIDDVILNVAGAFIGAVMFFAARRAA